MREYLSLSDEENPSTAYRWRVLRPGAGTGAQTPQQGERDLDGRLDTVRGPSQKRSWSFTLIIDSVPASASYGRYPDLERIWAAAEPLYMTLPGDTRVWRVWPTSDLSRQPLTPIVTGAGSYHLVTIGLITQ